MRRFDPDTVQNGHIYSSIKEEEVFIYRYWVNNNNNNNNTLFNHATFRSEKRSLKHVRAKTMYTINTFSVG